MKHKYFPKNKDELKVIIEKLINMYGNSVDLNCIDVSNVTDIGYIFFNSKFNGDISQWDVSNVKDMRYMFFNSKFNGDISRLDTTGIEYISNSFYNSRVNYIKNYKSEMSHKLVKTINLIK